LGGAEDELDVAILSRVTRWLERLGDGTCLAPWCMVRQDR